ncbi:Cell division cycle protein 20 B [Merluccius polli]|uniref:Cell division cycle protein 20 B n=1 Tax=Merluccius polli TaxID=89951 RepID=A0AA47M8J6_MERPO|nr:Cell division cycle protein 20 B [Merluccius polli]
MNVPRQQQYQQKNTTSPSRRSDSNLLACSCTGLIALALGSDVHLWNSETQSLEGHTHPGPDSPTHTQPGRACWPRRAVSSLCWSSDGRVLSIGTRQGQIQRQLERWGVCLWSHLSVVSALSWKQNILSSGSILGHIHHHDPRAPKPLVGAAVQQGSVCSLQWSPGEDRLASGSKDGRLSIWDGDFAACKLAKLQRQPLVTMKQPSAVKICSLLWVEERRVLVCGHGLPHHNISCWAAEHPDSLGKSHQLETLLPGFSLPEQTTVFTSGPCRPPLDTQPFSSGDLI